ncbi:MAG: hypothetical protein K1X29_04270 [Bdellovibrionales bacterium]|nr:hypothetical protein [Bdellovibrionales bacterium]
MRALFVFSTWTFVLYLHSTQAEQANSPSFDGVTQFQVLPVYGRLQITCHQRSYQRSNPADPTKMVLTQCSDSLLKPFELGHFNYDRIIDADTVFIENISNPDAPKKSYDYNAETMKSKSRVNLWINSLLQRALLTPGNNKIHISFFKKDRLQYEDQFGVFVDNTSEKGQTCPLKTINSFDMNDCFNPQMACEKYFNGHSCL